MFVFLLLRFEQSFFHLEQTLRKVIFFKVFKAGSGSALRKQLDPDLQKKNADPQPCRIHCPFLLFLIND